MHKLKSMTGFGEGKAASSLGEVTCEIHTTNRRYLEVSLTLPPLFSRYEMEVRTRVGEIISRGSVYVKVQWRANVAHMPALRFNKGLALALKQGWEEVAATLQVPNTFSLDFLKGEGDLFTLEEAVETPPLTLLEEAVGKALHHHLQMREKEGMTLSHDIVARLLEIEKAFIEIEKLQSQLVAAYREKLVKKIAAIFPEELEERVVKELAFFAEKADITEELVRFKSHLVEFRKVLSLPEAMGKKLDFLLQELGREINTIGAKAQLAEVTRTVVEIKTDLEKIREQVQNIE